MIPFAEQPSLHLGPITIHAFGVAVVMALWVGLTVGERRFQSAGLDPTVGNRLGTWIIVGGILGAHLFSVLVYFPDKLRADPWLLLRIWEDVSSIGGMVGGVIGGSLFFALRFSHADWRVRLRYADVVAFAFAPGLAIGRIGCALAHDHPGVVTSFPLAVSLKTTAARDCLSGVYAGAGLAFPPDAAARGFHDLGFYEFLFLALVVVPAFAWWNRQPRAVGFYLTAFVALYFPVRFGLDFLRVADIHYLNLTAAQWTAASILAVLPFLALRHRRMRFAISAMVILATAWACCGG
jgi:phosphatidylglycerol:prolipoprotein diacylglycerol transferase